MSAKLPWGWFLSFLVAFYFMEHYESIHPVDMAGTMEVSLSSAIAIQVYSTEQGSIIRRVTMLSLGVFAVVSMMRDRLQPLSVHGLLGGSILFFFFFVLMSPAWGEDIDLTLRRVVIFALFSLAALACARRFSLRELALFAFTICTLFLVLGLYREIAQGLFHPFAAGYRFQGSLYPNLQAWNCATIVLSASWLALATKQSRSLYLCVAVAAMLFLLLTKSRTSMGSVLLALTSYWSYLARSQKVLGVLGICLLTPPLLYFASGEEFFVVTHSAMLLGRTAEDITKLSGRTELWHHLLSYAAQRPLFGYGMNAFWDSRRMLIISQALGWAVGQAHSGYLELVLGVGVLGAGNYVLMLTLAIYRATTLHGVSGNPGYLFARAMLIFMASVMLLESFITTTTVPPFVCTVVLIRLGLVQTAVVGGRHTGKA